MDNRLSLRAMPIIAFARKFALIFMLICSFNFNSIVFGADRYTYNTSWDDNYLGKENIKQILNQMGYTTYDDSILNYCYDNFVTQYAKLKEMYPTANLQNLVFFANDTNVNSASKISVSLSNGTFANEDIPYIKLVYGSYYVDYLNYVSDENSEGTRAYSFSIYNGSLSNSQTFVRLSEINIDTTNEDAYEIGGKMFSWTESYTVVYRDNWAFLTNALNGLLISENEYLRPEIPEEPDNPDNPSGDTGTGDYTGQLNQIQGSLNNIENKIPTSGDMQGIISKETDKVINFMSGDADFNKEYTSGEILEKIDFTPIENPTANFWYELTQILNNALTGSGGNVVFKWFGNEYTITPEMINPPYPEELRVLLTTVSTVVVIFIIAKWIKIIADTSQGGNLDQLLEMNEEGIVNLF